MLKVKNQSNSNPKPIPGKKIDKSFVPPSSPKPPPKPADQPSKKKD